MEQKREITIKAKDEDLKGFYSNLVQISHTKEEFCLDFFNVFPPQGVLSARVIISPSHLKRMIRAMEENLRKYEEKYGNIEESEGVSGTIGFQPNNS